MRIAILGASGLVGAHLMHALQSLGQVRGTYYSVPVTNADRLDVRDRMSVARYFMQAPTDVVVVAAADPYVDRCEQEPEATRRVNVDGVANVADAARQMGARLVYFSSDYVFDGESGPYGESDAVHPINEYGRQKVAAEQIVRTLPRHLVCRISGVFGWEPRRKNFVCQVVDRLRAGTEVVAANDQTLCPTYAIELAEAVRGLLSRDFVGTIDVVGPEALTRAAFARRVAHAFELDETRIRDVATSGLSVKTPRPKNSALRDDLLCATLGHGLSPLVTSLARMRASEAAAAT